METFNLVSFTCVGVLWLLSISMLLALYRLLRGPSLADRVVALDLISILSVGLIVVYAIAAEQPVYLSAAIIVGLVAFIGTVAFSYFIEKGGRP